MRKLHFIVDIFDKADEPTSSCSFPSESEARERYHEAITSAPCGNVGRIRLSRHMFSGSPLRIAEWLPPNEEVRTAGYIVHSARMTKNESKDLDPRIFHETESDAIRQARQLADKWSLGHPGLIVFKAVRLVKKVERPVKAATRIEVTYV